MKKIFAMIILIMVIVSVSACGQLGSSEETGNDKNTEQQTKVSEKEDDSVFQVSKESKAEDFIYGKFPNGTPFIAGYKGNAEIITIPTSYEGVECKAVIWDALYAINGMENLKNIKKIIIPEGIERFTCDMPWKFENLESISFPSTLVETELHDICFDICRGSKVKEVIFPEEPVSGYFIEDDVIYKKVVYDKTTEHYDAGTEGRRLHLYLGKKECNEFTIPEDVMEISKKAFWDASPNLKKLTVKGNIAGFEIEAPTIEELILSDDAKHIGMGRGSLWGCDSLKSIYIGKTTGIDIDGGLHYAPLLEKISVSEEHEALFSKDDILYFRNNRGEVSVKLYPGGKTEEEFTLGEDVQYVGDCAFLADDDLKKLYVTSAFKEYVDDMDWEERHDKFAEELEIIVK